MYRFCSTFPCNIIVASVSCVSIFSHAFASVPFSSIYPLDIYFITTINNIYKCYTPVERVETLHKALINVMQNAQVLGWQGRYNQLHSILMQSYDFSNMARIASGSYWKTFTEIQKANVVEAFSRMSIATYASRFNTYGGEWFETIAVETLPQSHPSVMVRTRLVKRDGTEVQLSYRLVVARGSWRIVDVFYKGTISELANQRAQYLTVLKKSGYDRLLQKLNEKVNKLAVGEQEGSDGLP
ncbi:ABC-type transport system involved in resistance to organic solvents, auxiliary component [invertebrate metagenome]|uniref:ABC-type transport system involved in resistance to organic solvents, auxiliary component n=1 Tax=invertebrate metagenome TaxID=1711999 RepID=A0A484H5X5_9ZZZZ